MLHSTEVPTYIKRSLHYISLARGCLAAGDFITNASIGVIDATLICATYHFSAEEPYKAWVLVGVALKLAVGVGMFLICTKLSLTQLFDQMGLQ